MQNFIEKIVKSSRVTDREGLCILQGKLVWSVSVTLHLLNDDGNCFDAFFLASILALKNTRLPEASISKNTLMINDDKLKYLNVHHLPICTRFYFMREPVGVVNTDEDDLACKPMLDVNTQEEKLCQARLSIVLNAYGDLCGMTTLGALDIGEKEDDEDADDEDVAFVPQYDAQQLLDFIKIAEKNTK